ncbi:tetratricopeptide repeat protein [bacterium]|nr:tetratricopeptide repeat protein [bacterium]
MCAKVSVILLLAIGWLSCGESEPEANLWQRAQDFEKQENFAEALKTYEKQLQDYPNGEFAEEALYRLAFLNYNNVHDLEKALQLHQQLVGTYPNSKFVPQARFMIGYINANDLKNYDAAKVAYEDFLKYHSDNELAESVRWELEHLGKDINEQLQELFGNEKSNGESK